MHGQEVLEWFNPEAPETVALTTREHKYLVTADRFDGDAVPAIDGGEKLESAMRQINAAQAKPKTLYRTLKADFDLKFRPTVTTVKTVQLGAEINAVRAVHEQRRAEASRQVARVQRKASDIGMPREILGNDNATVTRGLDRMARALRGEQKAKPQEGERASI